MTFRKFAVVSCLFFFFLLGVAPQAMASQNPFQKFTRGVANIITFPLEIPKQARAYWIEGAYYTDHIIIWATSGAMIGIIEGVKRGGSGVWDVLTFPIERPRQYKALVLPDYVWQNWPSDPDVFIFLNKEAVDAK